MANGFQAGINLGQAFIQGRNRRRADELRSSLNSMMGNNNRLLNSAEFMELSQIDPQAAKQMQSVSLLREDALFKDVRQAKDILQSGDINGFVNFVKNRGQAIQALGGNPSDSLSILGTLEQGGSKAALDQLQILDNAGVERGFLSEIKAAQPIDKDFLKEERKVARDAVNTFNKRAGEIRSSFGKVESILTSGKLNRMKIASAMTSMARLLSPGIVTESDFRNLSNSTNPVATVINTLRGKGAEGESVVDELQKYVDPTNPDLFDRDAFLQTARNVAAAEAPALIDTLKDAEERGVTAGLSERAMAANFKNNKNLLALQKMVDANKPVMNHPTLGNITEEQIQKTMKNKNMTREQVLAILNQG